MYAMKNITKFLVPVIALVFLGVGCQTTKPSVQLLEVQSSMPTGKTTATSSDNVLVLHTNQDCQISFFISDPKPYPLDNGTVDGTYYTVVYGSKKQLIMEAVVQTPSEYSASADMNIDNHFSPAFITSNGNIARVLVYPSPSTMDCQAWLSNK